VGTVFDTEGTGRGLGDGGGGGGGGGGGLATDATSILSRGRLGTVCGGASCSSSDGGGSSSSSDGGGGSSSSSSGGGGGGGGVTAVVFAGFGGGFCGFGGGTGELIVRRLNALGADVVEDSTRLTQFCNILFITFTGFSVFPAAAGYVDSFKSTELRLFVWEPR
jgi:hypothetical protein